MAESDVMMDTVLYYSPLSREEAKKRLYKGRVGPEHELCTPSKHNECLRMGKCMGPIESRDPDCFPICRGLVAKELA